MDKQLVKCLIICSLILGIILGVFSVIPYLGTFLLFIVCLFSAPLVMLYLIMDGKYDLTTVQQSIIDGAIIGFFANITYCIGFSILSVLISIAFNYTPNVILTSMISKSPLWLFVIVIIFIGVLLATTNAFSGFLTYYIINTIRDLYEKKNLQRKEEDING